MQCFELSEDVLAFHRVHIYTEMTCFHYFNFQFMFRESFKCKNVTNWSTVGNRRRRKCQKVIYFICLDV